jgi:tetratricopeptide (TPR) repeat protein
MKKLLFFVLGFVPAAVFSQNIAEVQQMLQYEKYVSAESAAQSLLKNEPNNTTNWYWLSQVYLHKKDSTSLSGILQKMPASINKDAWYNITCGNVHLSAGKITEAKNYYEQAIDQTRGRDAGVLAAIARSNVYSNKGDKQYAIEVLGKAIKRDKRNPELHTMLGDVYYRTSNGSEAYKAYQEALSHNSKYAPALYALGKIFASQKNTELIVKYYNEAVAADPKFAPALYDLYYHYYYNDLNKAYDYYTQYLTVADKTSSDNYQLADLLYLTKKYPEAIAGINVLMQQTGADNRLNKLMAYTYKELNKPDSAIVYMQRYFNNGADTAFLAKDYELMAQVYESAEEQDSAAAYYLKALPYQKDSAVIVKYYKKLADHHKTKKDYTNQAEWLSKYYTLNSNATNVDLFNWGIALYMDKKYHSADSVFNIYATKFPEHVFGYYWKARANAAIDTAMTEGLAIPHYQQTIAIAEKDTANTTNVRYLVEAYGYIAAYTANEKKDFPAAIDYFEKLLVYDPDNSDAKKYISILEKSLQKEANKNGGTD